MYKKVNKNNIVINILICISFFSFSISLFANATPKFHIIAINKAPQFLPVNGNATAQYQVTNNTNLVRTLTMFPIPGINPNGEGNNSCGNVFTLLPHQFCFLNLIITGSQLPVYVNRGPVICKTQGKNNDSADLFLCSQPDIQDSLLMTVTPAEQVLLTITGSPLVLMANGSGNLTIINSSSWVTALNIHSDFSGTALEGNVIESGNNCSQVLPNHSCMLTYTAGSNGVALTSFPIYGSNTTSSTAQISVNAIPPANISLTNSPLTLVANGLSDDIIVNNISGVTVFNITSDFSGTALDGNVTETGNTCGVVLSGNSCTISYTPGSNVVTQTTFPIAGSNTATVYGAIAIDTEPLAIGDSWQGGIIFDINPDGVSGKVAAIIDNSSSLIWGTMGISIAAAQSNQDGEGNTAAIVAALGPGLTYAAGLCDAYSINSNGVSPCTGAPGETCYDDWYLPAICEVGPSTNNPPAALCPNGFANLYNNLFLNGFGSFNSAVYYWSSTQNSANPANGAWRQFFQNGNQVTTGKNSLNNVRCVRKFAP